MFKIGLYTLGCKVSQYETEAVGEELERRGFEIAPFDCVCDAYVINTCTVTRESDRKSRQMIRRAIAKNPDAVVAVMGCYTERDGEEVLSIDGVNIVVGTGGKLTVCDKIENMLLSGARDKIIYIEDLKDARFEPMCITRAPRTRAYVKIEDGCEARCTYCAIKEARGRVRSKKPEDVISEVEGLYRSGTREIVLTGIETGSYGRDFDTAYTLADLLIELDRRASAERIRLGSLAPELVGREFAEKIKGLKILAPHFHISMQSGSDKVLAAMKRRYNRKMALENIQRLRSYIPNANITTDLMVGFPGESEEDFLDTVKFVSDARLLSAHVFAYSRRRGTPAADYDGQIDESIKKERSKRLSLEVERVRDTILDEIVKDGKPLSVILEDSEGGVYTAHSDSFIEVSVSAPHKNQGDAVTVIPVSHKNGIVKARLVD